MTAVEHFHDLNSCDNSMTACVIDSCVCMYSIVCMYAFALGASLRYFSLLFVQVDRLIELYTIYGKKVEEAGLAEAEDDDYDDEGLTASESAALAAYRDASRHLRQMDAGLLTLQRLCMCIATLCSGVHTFTDAHPGQEVHSSLAALLESVSFAARAKLYEQGGSLIDIMDVLAEYGQQLDNDAAADSSDASGGTSSSGSGGDASVAHTRAFVLGLLRHLRHTSGTGEGSDGTDEAEVSAGVAATDAAGSASGSAGAAATGAKLSHDAMDASNDA